MKIGLGSATLSRIRLVFVSLLVLSLVTSGSTVYASYKSGQLNRVFVEPVNKLITDWETTQKRLAQQEEERNAARNFVRTTVVNSTSSGTVKVNSSVNTTTNVKTNKTTPNQNSQTQNSYTPPTYQPTQTGSTMESYEERVKASAAEAQKKWEEALQRQAELSAESKAANDKWFEDAKQKSQQDLEQWKKDHGF